jgi:hypothetical protein
MAYINVAVRQLPAGTAPIHPILPPGVERPALLYPGEVVTERFLDSLLHKAIHEVQVHSEDLAAWGLPTILIEPHVFERRRWTDCTAAMQNFVKNLTRGCQAEPDCERRRHKRYKLHCSVAVLPLDDDFRPAGPQFLAVCRDLSASGMALFHTRAIREKYLLVELQRPQSDPARLIMQVTRCRAVVRFYEIAGPLAATYLGVAASPPQCAPTEEMSDGLRKQLKLRITQQVRDAADDIRQRALSQADGGDRSREYREKLESGLHSLASRYSVPKSELTTMLTDILAEQAKSLP